MSLISASHIAAAKGNDEILSILISAGANPQLRDHAGRQPHHLAAANDNILALRTLLHSDSELIDSPVMPHLDRNIDIDTIDSWNHNHEENQELLSEEIEIGFSALHIASRRGNLKCVELLLSFDANLNTHDGKGLSPLDVAGTQPMGSDVYDASQTIDYRFNKDKEINESEIHKVMKILIDGGALMPKANIILKEGYVVNQRRKGVTALHTAVNNEDLPLTEYLLSRGACLTTWDEGGLSPVHLAVDLSSSTLLRSMLKFTISITGIRDAKGRIPLHLAVENGWKDGVEILLEAGSIVSATTNYNQTVLHIASERGRFIILEELLSLRESEQILESRNYKHETPLCCAVKNNRLECVKLLVSKGADTTFMLPGDLTLLHLAVRNNSREILQCLLESPGRERKDVKSKDERRGMTPLQIAAQEGYVDCVKELLDVKVDIFLETDGQTALHLAAKSGHLEVVQALVSHDQSILEVKNKSGWYPLHIAAGQGHSDCVRDMLLMGADISATVPNDSGNSTALDIIQYCVPKPVEFLEDIFNFYITINNFPVHDLECEIELKYDILVPNGGCEKQLKVIDAIINCGKDSLEESLLSHPLTESFLYLKWMKLRTYFILMILLYAALTISITTVSHITFIEKSNTTLCLVISMSARVMMFLCLIPIITVEIINASQLKRYYILDSESWVKWSVIISACILEALNPKLYWIHYLASVTVLLSWIELLFLISRWPTWGFYVLMFSRVASKVIKVLITFAFLMIGFAFAFQILFEASIPFRNILEALVKVIVMMTEFDYESMFENVQEPTSFFVVGRLMFVTFVLLVAMVMMNLIVGLSVNDISQLEAQGRTQQLAKQAGFLSFLELCLYSKKLDSLPLKWRKALSERRSVTTTVTINPARHSRSDVLFPKGIIENILSNISNRQNKTNMSNSLQNIYNKIETISQLFRTISKENLYENSIEIKNFKEILVSILEEQKSIKELIMKMENNNGIPICPREVNKKV
ncbi:transient receptor potential channel pyrexia isoform X2 [Halyomorpha halys]|nr:transient receptor potential channel pyrexia [Halyomorpha halys]